MLYLQHDFCNIIFKIKQNICSLRVSPPPPPPMKNSGCAPGFCFLQIILDCIILVLIGLIVSDDVKIRIGPEPDSLPCTHVLPRV
jgi:hypothetical protein